MHRPFGRRERDVQAWDADRQSGAFLPSFSVRRPVQLEDGVAAELHKGLRKTLKFRSEKQRVQGYIVSPDKMCLVMVEQKALIHQMRLAGIRPDPNNPGALPKRVEELAVSVQLGLSTLLQNRQSTLTLPVGVPERFDGGRSVGCPPQAWRGYGANYHRRGNAARPLSEVQQQKPENLTPNALLVVEKQLCIGAIAAAFSDEYPAFNVSPLIGGPRITLLRRSSPIHDGKFNELQSMLADVLPDELPLGDPVIHLQTHRNAEPQDLPVWPREMSSGRLRLVA